MLVGIACMKKNSPAKMAGLYIFRFAFAPLLAGFLFEFRHVHAVVVGVVANEPYDCARRRTSFLHESAFAAQKERQEFSRRTTCELFTQCVEHFLPCQTATVDHAVRGLQLAKLGSGESGPTQTYFIKAHDHRRAAIERDEWWHIANHARYTADHGQSADAAVLVHRHSA